jgi:uncharacterized protein YaaR (DUF327 family)
MKIERQAAMVKSVAKNMRQKERQQAEKEKKIDKMYSIMRKTGKALDEVTKTELTKSEYKFIVEYVENIMNCPIELYPNLAC